ncbi:uncharacterized protein A4U43_C06F16030 [Asparagus officinalis]|uniref:RING-type E3 ubiquitin transferase n=1 Tax=Asparagus officinalis TaxID=4686 RepID=A0A5P1ESU2_ASPOF|nr:uncharacterized protein A4U43_C06F16030 [Asparagus officinalis]
MGGAQCHEYQLPQAQEEVKSLKEDLDHAHHDMRLAKERLAYLKSEVWADKREKKDALDGAHITWTESKELWAKLNEELSRELLVKEDRFKYPSRVANNLDVLKTLEVQGKLRIVQENEEAVDEGEGKEAASKILVKALMTMSVLLPHLRGPTPLLVMLLARIHLRFMSRMLLLKGNVLLLLLFFVESL